MKKWNFIISAVTFILGVIFIFLSKDFPKTVSNAPGPGFWPSLLGICLIILAALLVLETLIGWNKNNNKELKLNTPAVKTVYKLMGIIVLFSVVLYIFGFVISVLLFIPAVMYLLEVRNWRFMIGTSFLITLSIYVIFILILHTPLPKPIFFR